MPNDEQCAKHFDKNKFGKMQKSNQLDYENHFEALICGGSPKSYTNKGGKSRFKRSIFNCKLGDVFLRLVHPVIKCNYSNA